MNETRARRRIRKAIEERGYTLTSLVWEPWRPGSEMEGMDGGWYGEVEPSDGLFMNHVMGLSVDEVLESIEQLLPPRSVSA